jgi:transposase
VLADHITLVLGATLPSACCPICQQPAHRIQSHYTRTLADLPLGTHRLLLHLRVRRFHCRTVGCPRWIFAEQFPQLARPWARRTCRLTSALQHLGLALGGTAGTRLAEQLHLPTTPDTLLRLVRQVPDPDPPTPRILGVDDWAWRRGRTYGTILCDLETGHAIDLLPDRQADTLVAWLLQHPGVTIISRDRAGAYADGAHRGAPSARQVADRWHLLKNLGDALERVITRLYLTLAQALVPPPPLSVVLSPGSEAGAVPPAGPAATSPAADANPPLPRVSPGANRWPTRREQRLQQERRARRLAHYQTAHMLRQQAWSIQAIAQHLGRHRDTVSGWLRCPTFPEIQEHAPRRSLLDPYKPYLQQRWQAGCHNAQQLWQEVVAQGFDGGRTIVAQYATRLRHETGTLVRRDATGAPRRPVAPRLPRIRRLRWLLSRPPSTLELDEWTLVTTLCRHSRDLTIAYGLIQDGQTIIREQQRADLASWVRVAQASGVPEMVSLAQGIVRDFDAVAAALELPWSNGPVEGHVNRLKMLKRQLYGRANFDLLRLRVLYAH